MKILVVLCVILCTTVYSRDLICNPCVHYWRPYFGVMPSDAVYSGLYGNGRKLFIARVFLPKQGKYDVKAISFQLYEKADHVDFAWPWSGVTMVGFGKIEILCKPKALSFPALVWQTVERDVKLDIKRLTQDCCFVEGGYITYRNKTHIPLIGRAANYDNKTGYVGAVITTKISSEMQPGLYVMIERKGVVLRNRYQILSYGCLNHRRELEGVPY